MQTLVPDLRLTQEGDKVMPSSDRREEVSKKALWSGRTISLLVSAFLLFDAIMKILKLAPAVEGTVRLGYPVATIVPIGLALLVSVALYLLLHTSALGAILLTAYLGGATATQVRVENPWFLFPVALGVLIWLGLYLRDGRLRAMIPLRKAPGRSKVVSENS